MTTLIKESTKWHEVATDLEQEKDKLASYDKTLLPLLEPIKNKRILDFGCGPGILANAIQKRGGKVKAYDINQSMLDKAAEKIGEENIIRSKTALPKEYFDIVICNLVLCIVNDEEAINICNDIREGLEKEGICFVGICNPKIYNVKESKLDFRFSKRGMYGKNHNYKKIKKEGGYEIIETHRPIHWYKQIFNECGFKLVETYYTPEYELNNKDIQDFVVFKLVRQ